MVVEVRKARPLLLRCWSPSPSQIMIYVLFGSTMRKLKLARTMFRGAKWAPKELKQDPQKYIHRSLKANSSRYYSALEPSRLLLTLSLPIRCCPKLFLAFGVLWQLSICQLSLKPALNSNSLKRLALHYQLLMDSSPLPASFYQHSMPAL